MYEGKQELESLGWLPNFWNREMKTTAVTTVRSHQRSQQALLVILLGGCVAIAAPRPTSVAYYTSFTTRARITWLTTRNPRLHAFSRLFFTQFGAHFENRTILQPFFQKPVRTFFCLTIVRSYHYVAYHRGCVYITCMLYMHIGDQELMCWKTTMHH